MIKDWFIGKKIMWDPVDKTVLANEQVIDGKVGIRSSCRKKKT